VRPPKVGEPTARIRQPLGPVDNVQLQTLQQPFRRSFLYQFVNSLGEIDGADGGPLHKLLHFLQTRFLSDQCDQCRRIENVIQSPVHIESGTFSNSATGNQKPETSN
jgi:hypothetical protein